MKQHDRSIKTNRTRFQFLRRHSSQQFLKFVLTSTVTSVDDNVLKSTRHATCRKRTNVSGESSFFFSFFSIQTQEQRDNQRHNGEIPRRSPHRTILIRICPAIIPKLCSAGGNFMPPDCIMSLFPGRGPDHLSRKDMTDKMIAATTNDKRIAFNRLQSRIITP